MKKALVGLVIIIIGAGVYWYGPTFWDSLQADVQQWPVAVPEVVEEEEHQAWEDIEPVEEVVEEPVVIEDIVDETEFVLESENEKTAAEKVMEALKEKWGYEEHFDLVILSEEPTTEVHKIYQDLNDNVQVHISEKATVDDILPSEDEGGVHREISFFALDADTGKGIPWATVSLRWGIIGETDEEGGLVFERIIPRSHDFMYFQARKVGYSPAFVKENLMYHEWSTVEVSLAMSTKGTVVAKTKAENIDVENVNLGMKVQDDCSLVDAEWTCVSGDVIVQSHFIGVNEAENISIPMQALIDGEIVELTSNGMAFIDFYSNEWDLLIYNNKPGEICYNVGQEAIDSWNEYFENDDRSKDGYRHFNKSSGYREFDENAKVTIGDGKFCVETSYIY